MNSLGVKIALALLSAAMSAYVSYQAYTAFYEPYETQMRPSGNIYRRWSSTAFSCGMKSS